MRKIKRQDVQQLLGRQFRMVKNGLDPAQVTAFLEENAGSSEAALERLKRYTSLQRLSETVWSMAEETRETADQIKQQAREEAEEEKARIIRESQLEAKQIVAETKARCITCVESTNSIIAEAVRKAKETLDSLLGEADSGLGNNSNVTYYSSNPAVEQVSGESPPASQHNVDGVSGNTEMQGMVRTQQSTETQQHHPITEELEETADSKFSPAEMNFEKALEETEDNRLRPAEVNFEKVLEEIEENQSGPAEMNFEKILEEDKPSNAAAQAKDNSSYNLYIGKLTLLILGEADRLWMSELRQRLDNIAGINVLMEAGSDAAEIIMTLSLANPVALTPILLDMPYVDKVIEDEHKTNKSSQNTPGVIGYNSGEELPETTLMVLISRNGNGNGKLAK